MSNTYLHCVPFLKLKGDYYEKSQDSIFNDSSDNASR